MPLLLYFWIALTLTSVSAETSAWHHWTDASSSFNDASTFVAQKTSDTSPKPRFNAASWSDSHGNRWIFGGFGGGNTSVAASMLNDFWKFSASENTWQLIGGSTDPRSSTPYHQSTGQQALIVQPVKVQPVGEAFPGARYLSCAWTGPDDSLWLFGGFGFSGSDVAGELNDMWKCDIHSGQWFLISPNSDRPVVSLPVGRHGAFSWVDSSANLWIFGGRSIASHSSGYFDDLWKHETNSGIWHLVKVGAQKPSPRYAGASFTDKNGNFWLFGGFGNIDNIHVAMNDMWKLTFVDGEALWVQQSTINVNGASKQGNQWPPASFLSSFWSNPAVDQFWMYGGTGFKNGNNVVYFDHLWKFNVATFIWTLVHINGEGSNTMARYSADGEKRESTPGSRCGASAWFDPATQQTWIFGGQGFPGKSSVGFMNDMWIFGDFVTTAKPSTSCPFGKICTDVILDNNKVVVSKATTLENSATILTGDLFVGAALTLKDASIVVEKSATFDSASVLEVDWTTPESVAKPVIQGHRVFLQGQLIVNMPESFSFVGANLTAKIKVDVIVSSLDITGRFQSVSVNFHLPDAKKCAAIKYSAVPTYTSDKVSIVISKHAKQGCGSSQFMVYWIAGVSLGGFFALLTISKSIDPVKRMYSNYKARKTLENVISIPKLPDFSPPQRK